MTFGREISSPPVRVLAGVLLAQTQSRINSLPHRPPTTPYLNVPMSLSIVQKLTGAAFNRLKFIEVRREK